MLLWPFRNLFIKLTLEYFIHSVNIYAMPWEYSQGNGTLAGEQGHPSEEKGTGPQGKGSFRQGGPGHFSAMTLG